MKDLSPLHELLLTLLANPKGYATDEVRGYSIEAVGRATCDLKRWGKAFCGKRGHRTARYFGSADLAKAWQDAGLKRSTTRVEPTRAMWLPDAVERITKDTKFTFGPSPRGPVYRTNTYSEL